MARRSVPEPSGAGHLFGGGWTEKKLSVLRKYLVAYTTALKKTTFIKGYIDAFAGTGYRQAMANATSSAVLGAAPPLFPDLCEAEPQDFLEGSAKIALQVDPPFDRYIFIEKNAERCEHLMQLKQAMPERAEAIDVRQGDANELVTGMCERSGWRERRAVLFLDPFGMQVEWKTIEAVAATQAIDMWLLFPLGIGVGRLLKRSGDLPEAWRERLDRLLGTTTWQDEFYKETRESLFQDVQIVERVSTSVIGRYFKDRLKTIFPAVADVPLLLFNSRNNPLYLLCFAAGNRGKGGIMAKKIAEDILLREMR